MNRLFALLCPVAFLSGCVAVPYDTDTVYYPAPTVSAHISSGNYHHYPYHPYGRPYPYYQPPVYVAPGPIIAPPPARFDHRRNGRPGVQTFPHPHQDHFRDGGRQEWQRSHKPQPQWQQHDSGRPEWQQRNGRHHDWRQNGRHDGRRSDGRHGDSHRQ